MSVHTVWTLFLILVIICALMAHLFLAASRQRAYRKAFYLKLAAGLCFIAAGALTASICSNHTFAALVMTALILGLAGDQLLALRFIYPEKNNLFFSIGGGSFAIGHVLYLLAVLHRGHIIPATAVSVAISGVIASLLYGKMQKTDGGSMKFMLIGYIILLSALNACAWGAVPGLLSAGSLILSAGTLLFLISDNFLFAYCFSPRNTHGMYRAVHITYYAAQLCIAASLGLIA